MEDPLAGWVNRVVIYGAQHYRKRATWSEDEGSHVLTDEAARFHALAWTGVSRIGYDCAVWALHRAGILDRAYEMTERGRQLPMLSKDDILRPDGSLLTETEWVEKYGRIIEEMA